MTENMTGVLVAAGVFALLCVPATAAVARAVGPGRSVTTLASAVAAVVTAYVGWAMAGALVLLVLSGCKPQPTPSPEPTWSLVLCWDGSTQRNVGVTSCDGHGGMR
ncbi:MAG: hypothetical protein ABWY81_10930 [Jiangellaceae bacterium]